MQSWRLDRIEAFGFGGLTIFGGKPFDLYIGGTNWCLEGQNGSGKTSLVSALLWALTGKRIREHEGPVPIFGSSLANPAAATLKTA
jgi:ABC-type multidrug transport system ATPase subunit